MTLLVPILASIGALCMSNPRRRKMRRRNPSTGLRDETDHEFDIGPVHVTISTWRNKNATAFVSVSASGPGGVKSWHAKSQGPSSGGYSKPDQALERVFHQVAGTWPLASSNRQMIGALANAAAVKVGAKINPRRRGRRNPPYHHHVGPVYMRNGRRNPSGARQPYETEKGPALLRHFLLLKRQGKFGQSYGESGSNDGAISLCNLYNDATAPNLYRTDADMKACKRVAMLCRRVRTNHYGSRITETSNGAWQLRRRNPRKKHRRTSRR